VSTPDPSPSPAPHNLEQQHKRAKDLLKAAREGDAAALARIRTVRTDAGGPSRELKLADAQLAIAREAGFDSWPKLVADLEARDVTAFRQAVRAGDVPRVRQLVTLPHVREHVNDPAFDFGARAAHVAARSEPLLAALLEGGADIQLKSDWANGPYTVLDHATEDTARFLLARGATLTPNAAARLGWLRELHALVDADPALVHARGGDGQQPLHEAKTVAIADFLLDRGAGIDVRCIDHQSTPAQYALADRADVCRRLLQRGATPDIFMAARLGDAGLATRLLDEDPGCAGARVNAPGYAPVPPFNIYCWTLGFGVTPAEVAARAGHRGVLDLLAARSSPKVRMASAIAMADEDTARAILAADPSLVASLTAQEHGQLAVAIFHERFDAAEIMLRLGFDPAGPGVDGGTALHAACWVGSVRLVERLIAHGGVGLDARDPTHQSTPLGWASFGSVHRRSRDGDYPGVIDRLADAGADITAPGNGAGLTLLEMAQGNPVVRDALRRRGAR
jgi:ankyrin repeat protein